MMKVLKFLGTNEIVLGICSLIGIVSFCMTLYVSIKTANIAKILRYNQITDKLEPDEYGEYITRLLNLVQSQFPSGEAFIDSILNQAKEE